MIYLSQILGKPVLFQHKKIGKVIDIAVHGNKHPAEVCKIRIKTGSKKIYISYDAATFENNHWVVTTKQLQDVPPDDKDFLLAEDLLDSQVIDTKGKRLVCVNDVLLESNGIMHPEAIEIGFAGIIRRLGIGNLFHLKVKTLSWSLIEAFDYDTGDIKLKVSESGLQALHPVEIAHILEKIGTKERLGIIHALDPKQAAFALEKTNSNTQISILKESSDTQMNTVVDTMHISKLVDIIELLNPFTSRQVLSRLEVDKAKKVENLMLYEDDVAGGLMETAFYQEHKDTTIKQALQTLEDRHKRPEDIVVVDDDEKLIGTIHTKDLINRDESRRIETVVSHDFGVREDTSFSYILRQFAGYNLRILPVTSSERKVLGVITMESILSRFIEENKEHHGN